MANDSDSNGNGNGHDVSAVGDGPTSPPSNPSTLPEDASLQARLEKAEQERGDFMDRMKRIAADFENYKKRVRREMEDASIRAKEGLLKEILPVLDNLDRANSAFEKGGSVDALAQGVKLVEKQVHAALEKFEVRGFDAMGQPFDPARHEAIQQVDRDDLAPGTVALVFARGYTIGAGGAGGTERLLRPAMVAVTRPRMAEPASSGGVGGISIEEAPTEPPNDGPGGAGGRFDGGQG